MKTLICVVLLALSALAKEEKEDHTVSVTKRNFIPEPSTTVSTLDHITTTDFHTHGHIFHGHSPWGYAGHVHTAGAIGHGLLLPQQTVVNSPVPVPILQPIPVKVDRPIPVPVPHLYPVPTEKHYPVPVVKEVPYPVVKNVPYPVERPVPYPVEKIIPYPVVRKVPYPVHIRVDRPVPVPVYKPYPIPVVRRVPYPVEKIVHYPVHIRHKVPVPHPVPVPVPKPYPVPVPHPVPVPYDRPYPVRVIKPYPVPYERKIPVPYPVPVPVLKPYRVPVPGPISVSSAESNVGHGIASHNYSPFLGSQHGLVGHESVACSIPENIAMGSFISNSGAIPQDYPSSTLTSPIPRLKSQHLDYLKPSVSLDNTELTDSSTIVEIRKSVEVPIASKLTRFHDDVHHSD